MEINFVALKEQLDTTNEKIITECAQGLSPEEIQHQKLIFGICDLDIHVKSVIKLLMEDYKDIHFILDDGSKDKTTCPVRNTKIIKKYLNENMDFNKKFVYNNICFLPKDYFCPLNYETKKMDITENTHGIHWFNASWMTKSDKLKHKIKRILKKLKIIKE